MLERRDTVAMARSARNTLSSPARSRPDQSAAPDDVEPGTVWLGRQPSEPAPDPAPDAAPAE